MDLCVYIEGFDDIYEDKIVYKVNHGYMKNESTFYVRAKDIASTPRYQYYSKPSFMYSLISSPETMVFYVDDDKEYYAEVVSQHPENIFPFDIFDNLDGLRMRSLVEFIDKVSFESSQMKSFKID